MAIVSKTIAQLDGGEPGGSTGAYVLVRYQDTNEQVEYVEVANHMPRVVKAQVFNTRTGQSMFNLELQPLPAGQVNFSMNLTAANRFKLDEYNVSL